MSMKIKLCIFVAVCALAIFSKAPVAVAVITIVVCGIVIWINEE